MPGIVKFIIGLEVLFAIFALIALIYFIIKRVEDKDKETFEKRKN